MPSSRSLRKFGVLRLPDGCPCRGVWKNFTVCEQPSNRRDRGWQSRSRSRVSAMKIEGLPVIDVDESEKITVAVRADDLLEGDTADPDRHPSPSPHVGKTM